MASRPVPAPKSSTSPVWQAKPASRAASLELLDQARLADAGLATQVDGLPASDLAAGARASPRNWRSSARRPTNGRLVRRRRRAGPSSRQARTGSAKPLTASVPASSQSSRSASARRTASEIRISSPARAASVRREARFTEVAGDSVLAVRRAAESRSPRPGRRRRRCAPRTAGPPPRRAPAWRRGWRAPRGPPARHRCRARPARRTPP